MLHENSLVLRKTVKIACVRVFAAYPGEKKKETRLADRTHSPPAGEEELKKRLVTDAVSP